MEPESRSILLVEDDEDLRSGLSFALRQEGYDVEAAATLAAARTAWSAGSYDLIILDVMLPDGSGFDFGSEVRGSRRRSDTPILFLTARDDEIDVIQGLEIGGDDYVTKPFRLRELLSRVKARLRRRPAASTHGGHEPIGPSAELEVDPARAEVRKAGRPVPLTASEYRLFLALAQHRGQTLTRDQLADRLLGMEDSVVDDNTVSVYIRRLREKIEDDPAHPRYIHTVRGIGYRMEDCC